VVSGPGISGDASVSFDPVESNALAATTICAATPPAGIAKSHGAVLPNLPSKRVRVS
jgi:hypothetical protein